MNGDRGFSAEAQRYLDQESGELADTRVQGEVERFKSAVATYVAGLAVPGREVDRAIMAVIRERRSPARQRARWRWFLEPQVLRVRPALAAAVAILLAVGLWSVAPSREGRGGAGAPVRERAATAAARTVLVRFELRVLDADEVTLVGTFNGWDESAIPLQKSPATGLWIATVSLLPGRYEYLFVVNGERWIPDPSAHAQVDDGFGQVNSVIVVGPRGVVRT
jgi:hypothetical protein